MACSLKEEARKRTFSSFCKVISNDTDDVCLAFGDIRNRATTMLAFNLAHNTSLTRLDLVCNDIGLKGAKALAGALVVNSTLTDLDLSNNKIQMMERRILCLVCILTQPFMNYVSVITT